MRVAAGEKVIWEKSAGSGCYVLLEGGLRVVSGPEERTLKELRPWAADAPEAAWDEAEAEAKAAGALIGAYP